MTTKATMTTIVYPETDGMPVPDGEFQYPLQSSVVLTLRAFFKEKAGSHVNGNTLLYYVEGNPRMVLSPDCYAVFDLSEDALESFERNNTYLLWDVEKPPDFVLEIGSPSTARVDMGSKRALYARLEVPEYWRYDALGGRFYDEPLVGERLVGGEYERMAMRREGDGSVWGHSDALNLDLWWIDGELRFWDPVGEEWLLNHEEEQAGRLAERAGRLAAEERAEEERVGRLAAEARVEEERAARLALEAELRRLRGG